MDCPSDYCSTVNKKKGKKGKREEIPRGAGTENTLKGKYVQLTLLIYVDLVNVIHN